MAISKKELIAMYKNEAKLDDEQLKTPEHDEMVSFCLKRANIELLLPELKQYDCIKVEAEHQMHNVYCNSNYERTYPAGICDIKIMAGNLNKLQPSKFTVEKCATSGKMRQF
jgi:hypothetical protein